MIPVLDRRFNDTEGFAMIRNVLFDCGGVVCEFVIPEIVARYFEPEDCALAQETLFSHWADMDAGDIRYEDYAREMIGRMPERLRENTVRFFDGWYRTQPPIEDIWALAARLKARGYRVYLLSNAPTVYAEQIADVFPVIRMFDGMVISAPIHMIKPHADIFEYALTTFGLKPEESLFVDDMEVNVEGARACGLQGFHFRGDVDALQKYIEAH